jgi:excisionase family DNA binding protein
MEQAELKKRVYTRKEAAEFLRVSYVTLDRRIRDGTLPVTRFGTRVLITLESLEKIITPNQ